MESPTPRPRIAVSCDFEKKTGSRGQEETRFWLNETYVKALNLAGADVYLLPPVPDLSLASALNLLRPTDGLIISGGAFDIDPERYGQEVHPLCGPRIPARSLCEEQLLLAAHKLELPCLGVCAGMQLMVVMHQGTLFQDLSLRPNTAVHEQPFDKGRPFHKVTLQKGSLLQRSLSPQGAATIEVNSTHHQIVDSPGTLQAVGHSPDGVIEAVEREAGPFYVGVQWHPEALADGSGLPLYKALVAAAKKRQRP